MYLAEGISKDSNNFVEIVSTKNNIIEDIYLGVKYTNFNNFEVKSCDYIIISNNLETLSILDKIHTYNKIIILTQNDLHSYNKLFSIDKNKIIIGYISEFAKTNILNVQPFLNEYNNFLLYNSIDLDDIQSLNINDKENNLCYFACIERGYKMVVEILSKLDNYHLFTNTYCDNNRASLFEESLSYRYSFFKFRIIKL